MAYKMNELPNADNIDVILDVLSRLRSRDAAARALRPEALQALKGYIQADAEKLAQLTGEDHTPEFLVDCEACDGKGYIARTVHVYEAGCGFSHPDVEEKPCEACGGNGWFVLEAEGDR